VQIVQFGTSHRDLSSFGGGCGVITFGHHWLFYDHGAPTLSHFAAARGHRSRVLHRTAEGADTSNAVYVPVDNLIVLHDRGLTGAVNRGASVGLFWRWDPLA
jgi:hypothetical protein